MLALIANVLSLSFRVLKMKKSALISAQLMISCRLLMVKMEVCVNNGSTPSFCGDCWLHLFVFGQNCILYGKKGEQDERKRNFV